MVGAFLRSRYQPVLIRMCTRELCLSHATFMLRLTTPGKLKTHDAHTEILRYFHFLLVFMYIRN